MVEKIGYLGPEGTFSEEAALKWAEQLANKGITGELVPLKSFESIFRQVEKGEIKSGILPLENSREGSVSLNMDLLAAEEGVRIKGEVILNIKHYLFAPQCMAVKDIKKVHSHPQALAQCHDFIIREMPDVSEVHHLSTAQAAREISLQKGPQAALVTRRAGHIYGLKEIMPVPEEGESQTRFIILGLEDVPPSNNDKTSLLFTVDDGPGSLFRVLEVFARKNINLSKIESRPTKKELGDYMFFVDFAGHFQDKLVKEVLANVEKRVPFLKVLGSYVRSEM